MSELSQAVLAIVSAYGDFKIDVEKRRSRR
jgi:hypothetical protein